MSSPATALGHAIPTGASWWELVVTTKPVHSLFLHFLSRIFSVEGCGHPTHRAGEGGCGRLWPTGTSPSYESWVLMGHLPGSPLSAPCPAPTVGGQQTVVRVT